MPSPARRDRAHRLPGRAGGADQARKHAPGAPVAVTVTGNGRPGLLVEIISGHTASTGSQGMPPVSGTGAGLIGLAERVTLAGGTLQQGTNAAGEFVLRASVPASS